jgi:hypothetical protein
VEHQDAIEQTFSAHAATFRTSQQLVEDSSTRLLRIRMTQLANGGSYEAASGVPELHCVHCATCTVTKWYTSG